MTPQLSDLAAVAGVELFDHQRELLEDVADLESNRRICIYFRTGAGKTLTALLALAQWGYDEALVIAPPSTHGHWRDAGHLLDIRVDVMSHAKFRMPGTKVSRRRPVIADEFHLFGGQQGKGWRKFDKLALHLDAPLIIMSATPNYNDAERVYCIAHVLRPHAHKGGYLQFLYENCHTAEDPFSRTPKVLGFKDYPDAAHFLADLPGVHYLPDNRQVRIRDIPYNEEIPEEMETHGYNRRAHRLIASDMEGRQTRRYQGLVNELHHVRPEVMERIVEVIDDRGTVLLFCARAQVAHALSATLTKYGIEHELVTGQTGKGQKAARIDRFRRGETRILIGTATLATGTDGLDKVCDTLLIVDDTDDDALRRQLIGRILPRGVDAPIHTQQVLRMIPA